MAINGRNYDWEDIAVTLPSGEAVGITELKYSDEQSIEARYGKGATPRGYGRGNYSASGSMTLDRDEWERLVESLTSEGDGGIYDHAPFTIVANYANNDMGEITDTLKSCKVTKFDGGGGSQGDDNVSPMNCEFVILEPIEWNGRAAKANASSTL